ncbi:hypothetical protein [Hymenobacter sp. BRD67]|uniref:hypothetical protein n=1 Tax=Hymenobacter sp. BRD67 TaxID=2675877 RepID=UPI0015630F8E|nr:hypothetical protein [Hymenobacter sp. BRD67]QKG51922.1 hypothetical protein GKZ67_03960 [Hymenobacter sp. BRD67]
MAASTVLVSGPAELPQAAPLPLALKLSPKQNALAGLAAVAESTHEAAQAGLLRRGYLHGEAWTSETLPLNGALKLGVPRIYLVLGAALGPFDHQSGPSWGVGIGTAGRSRGRFTLSLDLMQWFVGGDREAPPSLLTQLRPQLAWQLRQGSRWQLLAGPTLNLATAHQEGPRLHWPLGQDQWLWLNSDRGRTCCAFGPACK